MLQRGTTPPGGIRDLNNLGQLWHHLVGRAMPAGTCVTKNGGRGPPYGTVDLQTMTS